MLGRKKSGVKTLAKTFQGIRYHFNKRKMVTFNSIIVFDAETTGLPHLENNNTKMTEVALIGCEIQHLKNTKCLPRVLHKLVFCFNPMKMIQPESTNISGLENELLMNLKPFTETDAEVLSHFVKRLPSPVCIIAHNGYKFDFPILQSQLHKLNFRLPDDVYCFDSLKAFQEIYPKPSSSLNPNRKTTTKGIAEEVTPKKDDSVLSSSTDKDIEVVYMSNNIKTKVVKNLFPLMSPGNAEIEMLSPVKEKVTESIEMEVSKAPLKYKLSSIYEFLHGKDYPDSHRAEEDCKALLSCIIKCDKFLNWMNEKAVLFNTIKPLL